MDNAMTITANCNLHLGHNHDKLVFQITREHPYPAKSGKLYTCSYI